MIAPHLSGLLVSARVYKRLADVCLTHLVHEYPALHAQEVFYLEVYNFWSNL